MSHYYALTMRSLSAVAKEHGLEASDEKEEMIAQILENDIVELAKEKGISEEGMPRLPPRLPPYNKHGQPLEMPAFCAAYIIWSTQNRVILENYEKSMGLINQEEYERLKTYIQAEDDFIAPADGQEEAVKRWHRLLDSAQEVGVYVYEYRHVNDPKTDRCSTVVRADLRKALQQARDDRAAMLEARAKIAAEKAAELKRIAEEKAAAERAAIEKAAREQAEKERIQREKERAQRQREEQARRDEQAREEERQWLLEQQRKREESCCCAIM